jgi:hypothetical protein
VVDIVRAELIFPPAKICDLGVTYHRERRELLAAWTAPDRDYSEGYHLLYAGTSDNLLGDTDTQRIVFSGRDRAGSRVEYTAHLPSLTSDLYVGLRAEDQSGSLGRISNLVYVRIPAQAESGSPDEAEDDVASVTLSEWNMLVLGSVVGTVLVITLSLLTGLACWLCRKRHSSKHSSLHGFSTKSSGVNAAIPSPAHSVATDTSSYRSEGKHSNHMLVPPMVKPLPSSTSFAANITPTYWSASQILGHQDLKHNDHGYNVTGQEYGHHVHPDQHVHHPLNTYYTDDDDHDDHYVNYGSDLVDEALEVNTSNYKSDETSSTLPSDQGSVTNMNPRQDEALIHRNITQV